MKLFLFLGRFSCKRECANFQTLKRHGRIGPLWGRVLADQISAGAALHLFVSNFV